MIYIYICVCVVCTFELILLLATSSRVMHCRLMTISLLAGYMHLPLHDGVRALQQNNCSIASGITAVALKLAS